MKALLSARSLIALAAIFGSTATVAAQPAGDVTPLPNAADPKPAASHAPGAAQAAVVTLSKRGEAQASSQTQDHEPAASPDDRKTRGAPFHRPDPE